MQSGKILGNSGNSATKVRELAKLGRNVGVLGISWIFHFSRTLRVYKKRYLYAHSRVFYYWGLGNINNLGRLGKNINKIPFIYAHSRVFYYWGLGKKINLN